jgi:hypothetical protein
VLLLVVTVAVVRVAVMTVVLRMVRRVMVVVAGAVFFVFVMFVVAGAVFVSGYLMQYFLDKFAEHLGVPPYWFSCLVIRRERFKVSTISTPAT